MPLKYIHNDTAQPKMIGGRLIPPGEGREVETEALPPELQDAHETAALAEGGNAEEAARLANLQALLEGSVKDVTEQLPGFATETLADLVALETAGKNRSTLLQALGALRLERAQAAAGGAPT